MKIIFMGSSEFSVPALTLLAKTHEIIAVYTKEPKPAGRGLKLTKTILHRHAEDLNIPVFTPKNFKSPQIIEEFITLKADIAVVAAYGIILPQIILNTPKFGCINIHASLLPRWRGAAPIHRAIMAGDTHTGVSIMNMSVGLDEGDIYDTWSLDITNDMTMGHLHDILSEQGAMILLSVLEKIKASEAIKTPQPLEGITYANKIGKQECCIDWNKSAQEILNHIHGLNPFPSAFCYIDTVRYKIHEAVKTDNPNPEDKFTFACADGFIRAKIIQKEGKGKQILF